MSDQSTEPMNSREMPRYLCHKQVWALKIKAVFLNHPSGSDNRALLTPENTEYAPFLVAKEYVAKHNPQEGGYYVVYDDGYKSYSPAKAFEDGYTLID